MILLALEALGTFMAVFLVIGVLKEVFNIGGF